MNRHLTDEEFAQALLGEGEWGTGAAAGHSAAAGHLASCEACREELAQVHGALAVFGRVSLAEAEGRASAAVRPAAVRAAGERWRPAPSWWAAAAAAMLAVVMVSVGHGRPGDAARGPEAAGGTKAQITEDNELLSNIDAELRWQQGGAVQMSAGSLRARGGSQTE